MQFFWIRLNRPTFTNSNIYYFNSKNIDWKTELVKVKKTI